MFRVYAARYAAYVSVPVPVRVLCRVCDRDGGYLSTRDIIFKRDATLTRLFRRFNISICTRLDGLDGLPALQLPGDGLETAGRDAWRTAVRSIHPSLTDVQASRTSIAIGFQLQKRC